MSAETFQEAKLNDTFEYQNFCFVNEDAEDEIELEKRWRLSKAFDGAHRPNGTARHSARLSSFRIKPDIRTTPFAWQDPATIPKRRWVYGRHYIRQFVGVTVAPGGMGKSSLSIVEALAMCTGRPLLGETVYEPCKVWLWNGEDPFEEMQRRIIAACRYHGITEADIAGRLFVDSGRDMPMVLVREASEGIEVAEPQVEAIVETIRANEIDMFIADPFVLTHQVNENSNTAVDQAMRQWAKIAEKTNTAGGLFHHVRKGNAGLEELQPNCSVRGILPNGLATVVSVKWFGSEALELTYKDAVGKVANELLYRHDEPRIEILELGRPWSFDGDGELFRLAAEAQRIQLAHLFDPVLAVHTSIVEPLPHQITAVYEAMLPRQPLRFLLADDPGAGKTIMAGLLMKELIARGDLQRCLVVCPGSLAEQWQDELYRRFNLPFEILTNDKLEAARTGNWFLETNLVIARLDKLSRNEDVQQKLQAPDCRWDLIVCDEAHKMSATFFGGEVKYTKRYRLAQLLSSLTRHFLLMTATPHNGKEEDFQLFMALLDGDRFEGKFRDGVHAADVSDLMRRMVKENLLKFDATPLFPERIANTVPYRLSSNEEALYKSVTDYVREEFNRAEALENDKRAGTVGFALTILQRRLASSPEAIYQSLRRRRERLECRMRELETLQRGGEGLAAMRAQLPILDTEDIEDFEDAPDQELEDAEEQILDQATAARSIAELRTEIETLKRLEAMALTIRRGGEDRKWRELASLLTEIFSTASAMNGVSENGRRQEAGIPEKAKPVPSPHQKLVIFTEHRDTLNYLMQRVSSLLGRSEAVVAIHGGMGREERLKAQESFKHDPQVQVLLATDAAGEGINLQRAHLMVNYDLPWNPNRIEQRFGRIHRIGQTEVCHLWNLVAEGTREGEVYLRLLEKLEQARTSLGGQVFDVLGKLQFDGKPLRELLIAAIRHGENLEVRARLTRVVENAFNREELQDLLEEKALAHDSMDASKVHRIREDMERADARRLQPHYIESFFIEAFQRLGGTMKKREPNRFEITNVPAPIRNRDRQIGIGEPVLPRYERIAFDKALVAPVGQILAAFVCPGHPLLDSTIDLTLERHRDLLRRGTVLVDERDSGTTPRVLFFLEHAIQDGSLTKSGDRRIISKRLLFVEIDGSGEARHLNYAPYLDYRSCKDSEPHVDALLARPECGWIDKQLETRAQEHAIAHVVPEHVVEVRNQKLALLDKTEAAVKDRLTKEINYWDLRANQLKDQEAAGKSNARVNSGEARKRADALASRLEKRMDEIKRERQISPLPPVVLGGVLVVPIGLITQMTGLVTAEPVTPVDTQIAAAKARAIVMDVERSLGFVPVDRELEKLGYDVESAIPGTGRLRFIEVKGRVSGATTRRGAALLPQVGNAQRLQICAEMFLRRIRTTHANPAHT